MSRSSRLYLAVGVLVGLAASVPALAAAFDAFKTFCVETDGTADLIAAAAKRQFWFSAPEAEISDFRREGWVTQGFTDVQSGVGKSTFYDLVVSSTPLEQTPQGGVMIDISFCMVISTRPDGSIDAELSALIGPGIRSPDGARTWLYSRSGGQVVEESGLYGASPATLRAAWMDRSIYMVTLPSEPGPQGAGAVLIAQRRPGS